MSNITLIILFLILFLNYYIYKKFKYSKSLYIISTTFIIVNFIFILLIYYNNLALGFDEGIVFGDKLGVLATDEYKYYMEADHLNYNLRTYGGLKAYFNGELVGYPFKVDNKPYGIYNHFVFILGILRYIGISKLVDLLTIKLIFTVINTYLIYSLSKKFLNDKASKIVVILFNLAPAYILVNATLLRDNIILTFILVLILLLINKEWSYRNLILIFITTIALAIFRVYTLVALIAAMVFTFKKESKVINKIDIGFIILFIVGLFIFDKVSINIDQVEYLRCNYHEYFGTGLIGAVKLIVLTVKHIFVRALFLNTLPTSSIYVILTILGAVYYIALVPLFIYKVIAILFTGQDESKNWLCKFTIYFTLFNAVILMLKDVMIPTRLTIMWYVLHMIIILLPINKKDVK